MNPQVVVKTNEEPCADARAYYCRNCENISTKKKLPRETKKDN